MITINDPDLEAMLRVIEQETGEPPATVLRRAMAHAFHDRAGSEDPARRWPAAGLSAGVGAGSPGNAPAPANAAERPSPWALLAEMAGSVDMPPDWSAEHDHYLYGTPKRAPDA